MLSESRGGIGKLYLGLRCDTVLEEPAGAREGDFYVRRGEGDYRWSLSRLGLIYIGGQGGTGREEASLNTSG
jgi:hypothetical protein